MYRAKRFLYHSTFHFTMLLRKSPVTSVTSAVLLSVCSVHGTYTASMHATRGDPIMLPCNLPAGMDPSTVVVRAKTLLLSAV